MTISLSDLLILGQGKDLASERGVSCSGALPEASDPQLIERAKAARAALGDRALILGHHYQRDEVIAFADITGDSFKLAQAAAAQSDAEFIFFCGVHFMAESADILTTSKQRVILPDLAAGCSMADMATANQVNECWKQLEKIGVAPQTTPVTYMNSSAAIKSFTGEHGGTICTSSNAEKSLRWAFEKSEKVLFLPDQHLGRNTAVRSLGLSIDDCVLWNPWKPMGGLTEDEIRGAKMILWRGHCSVHGRFTRESIDELRARIDGIQIIVHPECQHEVVTAADVVGSTEKIIQTVSQSPSGSIWAVGTELNLVSRLAQGVLTGKYLPGKKPPAGSRATDKKSGANFISTFMKDEVLQAVQNLRPIADAHGLTLSQLAIAWVLHNENVAAAIMGATKPSQVKENSKASGVKLSADAISAIDKVLGDLPERDDTLDRTPRPRA